MLGVKPADVNRNLYGVNMADYKSVMARRTPPSRTKPSPATKAAPRPGRKARIKAAVSARSSPRGKPLSRYHHGDLHDALLKAAEAVLERDGLAGLTLRAVAREAGVSHAAPAHHFRDLAGLVSELAAIGYRRFGAAMAAADAPGRRPADVGLARGHAYLDFARAHPALYQLMFRAERLDMSNPALQQAADASFAGLVAAVGEGRGETIAEAALTLDQAADVARAWSLMHGFVTLLLDGRLSEILQRLPAGNAADDLLDAMLKGSRLPGQSSTG